MAFVKHYLIHKNATRAAREAGYSEKTAHAIGHKLLKHADIKNLLVKQAEADIKRLDITAARVKEELAMIAFMDFDQVGKHKRYHTSDKTKCLELLAKHFKLLTDVVELSGKDGGPQVILTMPANGSEKPTGSDQGENGCGAN